MQAQKAPPPDMACRDKFLVQCTVVAEETVEEDITSAMFSKDDGKYVQENKMRVILISPPSSPVLSPINGGVHIDLPSYKDPPRRDQVHDVNGVHRHSGGYEDSLTRDQVILLNQSPPKEMDDNVKDFKKENANMQMEGKHVQLETRKHGEEMELVKDVVNMKSKISELERKLSEVMLTSKKGGKKVRVGFPLLYVVTVAFISMVFGYLLHY